MAKKQKNDQPLSFRIERVKIDSLTRTFKTREDNPNKMTDESFTALVNVIKANGMVQPILVSRDEMRIVDGHHRTDATALAGYTEIDAVVVDADSARALALSIGMNKNRGELEYVQVAEVLKQLSDGAGWATSMIATHTGFDSEEIAALLDDVTAPDAAEMLEEAVDAPKEDEPEAPLPKPFTLEISFTSKEEYQLCRRKLKKAAGKGNDLSIGLMNVLGLTQDPEEKEG